MFGSTYEQGFIRFGTFFKVYAQAAPQFRRFPSDVMKMYVKNDKGEMVPYSAFMTMRKTEGPNEITRYNMYNSAAIRGGPAKGYTSGDAINTVREVADGRKLIRDEQDSPLSESVVPHPPEEAPHA